MGGVYGEASVLQSLLGFLWKPHWGPYYLLSEVQARVCCYCPQGWCFSSSIGVNSKHYRVVAFRSMVPKLVHWYPLEKLEEGHTPLRGVATKWLSQLWCCHDQGAFKHTRCVCHASLWLVAGGSQTLLQASPLLNTLHLQLWPIFKLWLQKQKWVMIMIRAVCRTRRPAQGTMGLPKF